MQMDLAFDMFFNPTLGFLGLIFVDDRCRLMCCDGISTINTWPLNVAKIFSK
jgi:hypothetical protein